jgi:hypothetical protein
MVNAERVINGSSPEQSQELFDTMVHFLSRRRLLTRILLDGVIHNHMLLILEKVVNGRIKTIDIPWRGQPTPDLDAFWQSMRDFLDGTPGRSIILGLNGFHDHLPVRFSQDLPPAAFRMLDRQAPPQTPAAPRPDLLPLQRLTAAQGEASCTPTPAT